MRPVDGNKYREKGHYYANYRCIICNTEKRCKIAHVKSGATKSCGCLASLKPDIDLQGKEIKNILFIGYIAKGFWKVKYTCGCFGKLTKTLAEKAKTGKCFSCYNRYAKVLTEKHGYSRRKGSEPTYNSWLNMRRRCYDEKNNRYKYYGAKGVTVCERWKNSFENFLEDMGKAPDGCSIERINLEEGYNKNNCKWATVKEQANNKTNNILISKGDETMSLRHWCEIEKIDYKRAHYLFRYRNESIENILGKEYTLV